MTDFTPTEYKAHVESIADRHIQDAQSRGLTLVSAGLVLLDTEGHYIWFNRAYPNFHNAFTHANTHIVGFLGLVDDLRTFYMHLAHQFEKDQVARAKVIELSQALAKIGRPSKKLSMFSALLEKEISEYAFNCTKAIYLYEVGDEKHLLVESTTGEWRDERVA